MEDFLKDRPVFAPQEGKIVSLVPLTPAGGVTSFSRLGRDEGAASRVFGASPGAAKSGIGAAGHGAGVDHAAKVQPIVENGRVTRIVVTCACGRITEVACVY